MPVSFFVTFFVLIVFIIYSMVSFPNCKINLGLNIVNKRNDGYHDIETVFFPIHLRDSLEVIEKEKFEFSTSGFSIEGESEKNLCIKAYNLLKVDLPHLQMVQMHLHKAIPMGAGLGGGSADGAFTLKLLNKKFDLSLSEKQLINYSLQLGSDCPFFILNKPCFATGRGEILEQTELDLSEYKFLIVQPLIHISTAWAFSTIKPLRPAKSIKQIIQQSISTWKTELINDFENPVFEKYPEIKNIKDSLYDAGAIYASMSGSGSAVYGIFKNENAISISFPDNYFVKTLFS
ncbi:MAG TPA: 4-(cytidine 5'-diphospho)-2-C-methyl-D-erythritol kinase [Chitinophagaceae bacterium]|nr:4-(cytidine 5'-diphospho)-2-C-methyl-D-erythritol kinase [Chitinophagaceae bacterium]